MKLRTEIQPLKYRGTIDLQRSIVMIGSCFTDNIGEALRRRMFNVTVNPFGTLFNPSSMATAIHDALDRRRFTREDLIVSEGRYVTFSRHSSWSDTDPDRLLDRLNSSVKEAADALEKCDVLIATFGSAIAFRDNASGEIVANCHKQPSSRFTREEIPVESVVEQWSRVIERLRLINQSLTVILTVSPVRHAGYGLTVDRLSKSRLLLAADELTRRYPGVIYFPAYEIMVDDLRDYRFYTDDLIHPSPMAISYIFDLFTESFVSESDTAIASRWERLSLRAGHRHRADDPMADDFIKTTDELALSLANEYSEKYPGLYNRFKTYSSCQLI